MPSIFLDFERSLAASVSDVNAELQRTLHDLGFQVSSQQLTLLEAKRGSAMAGGLLGAAKAPVLFHATINADGDHSSVAVRLSDHLASIGRTWGMNTSYQTVFADIQQRIDSGLARLDPSAAPAFAQARFSSKAGNVAVLESTSRVSGSLTGAATAKANDLLSGGPRTRVPDAWKKLDTVVLSSDEGAARLEIDELQAHLAVAMLITTQPGSMPAGLAKHVEALAARVEAALNQAGASRYLEIPISDDEEPVVEFLHQQARLRELLPVRTLHRCRTCKLEKITNPDYERLQKRNQRLRAIGGSVGATIGKSGVSPFVLVGTLFRFAKLDPDYVCARCQGTDAETMVVTFCPQCGALRSEAVLRICATCKLDFRTKLSAENVWEPYPSPPREMGLPGSLPGHGPQSFPPPPKPPPPAAAPHVGGPQIGPHGGKLCSVCGEEFSTLYRAVVASDGVEAECFVCGRPPRCAPQSVTTPVMV